VTDIACLAFASAYCDIEVAIVKVLLASSYVVVIPVPSCINAFTLSSTLSLVKYKLEEHGFAKVKIITKNEIKEGVKVEYWDFESDDEEYDLLSVEKWSGSELEVTVGWSAKQYEFTIYPAGSREE
jgi:hypothetical protein